MTLKKLFGGIKKEAKITNEKNEVVTNPLEEKSPGPIVTIAREFGSGGREIGIKLSQKLQFDFYDKEKIIEAAKEKGIDTSLLEQLDESKINSFWYHVSPKEYDMPEKAESYEEQVNNDKMFMIQSDAIRNLAEKGNAIFVGRCASYILKSKAKRIFIKANMEDRIQRIEKRYQLDRKKATQLIHMADEKREQYYDYYTNTKWNDLKNYDLVVDVSQMGIEGAVDAIAKYIQN